MSFFILSLYGASTFFTSAFGHAFFESHQTVFTESFARMKAAYPCIKMYTWFNIKKELDWRVNSSPQALEAFRAAMADPYFLSEYER